MHSFNKAQFLAKCLVVRLAGAAFVVAFVVACGAASGAELSTGEPTTEFFPQPTEAAQRLTHAFDKEISLNFHQTPLADVASWLQHELGVPVVLDRRSLNDAGIQASTPITCEFRRLSARIGLELMMAGLDIEVLKKEEYLLFTSQDRAETEYITRVYPVGDLVTTDSDAFRIGWADFDSLIEVIITQVRPQAWGIHPEVSVMDECASLVIYQDRKMHDGVLQLLRALRAAKRESAASDSK